MRAPRYIEPALSAIFLTSASIHLVTSRRTYSEERAKLTAQQTILGDLISRVRQGERIPDAEYSRLIALASLNQAEAPAKDLSSNVNDQPVQGPRTSWKEVLLGRKPSAESNDELEEQARLEWEEGGQKSIRLWIYPLGNSALQSFFVAALRPISPSETEVQLLSSPLVVTPSLPPPTFDSPVTAESHEPMQSRRYL